MTKRSERPLSGTQKALIGSAVGLAFATAIGGIVYAGWSAISDSLEARAHQRACEDDANRMNRPDDGELRVIPQNCYFPDP